MPLKNAIANALDLTVRLQSALRLGDVELCTDLLELRGAAMAAFETAHRQAAEPEVARCGDLLQELKAADTDLQRLAADGLDRTATEFRTCLSSGPGGTPGAYGGSSGQACVDRKA